MNMKTQNQKLCATLLSALVLIVTLGCGAISSLVGGGGGTKATTMWADVPALDGATQTNVDIPLPIRLAIKAIVTGAVNSENSNNLTATTRNSTISTSLPTPPPNLPQMCKVFTRPKR